MITLSLDQIGYLLDEFYDLGRLVSARFLDKGFVNTSYEIVIEKGGREGRYFFRLYRPGSSTPKVRFEHSLMAELKQRGFGLTPRLIPTRSGETFLELEERSWCRRGPCHLAIFSHLAGEDNHAWDRPECTRAELSSAAETLGRYHTAIFGWQVKRDWPEPPIIGALPGFGPRWLKLAKEAGRTGFDRHFLSNAEEAAELAESLRSELSPALYRVLPRLAVHGDFHPGNLKFDRGRVVGLFDFDWANLDLRIFDLALALNYFCATWEPAVEGRLNIDRMELFLKRYQIFTARAGRGPGPLNEPELAVLPQLLQIGNLYILDWIVDDFYQTGADSELYLGYLLHRLRMNRWLDRHSDRLAGIFQDHRRLFLKYEPRPWAAGLEEVPDQVPEPRPLMENLIRPREGLYRGRKGLDFGRVRMGEAPPKGRSNPTKPKDN